jgi:hypothetical protein
MQSANFHSQVVVPPAQPRADVDKPTLPLVAGNNTVPHSLGLTPNEVEVRNAATGAIISARLIAANAANVVIFVPVAVAAATVALDA